MKGKTFLISALCAVFLFIALSAFLSAAEQKGIKAGLKSGEYAARIKRISGAVAHELVSKGVKSLRVDPFRDGKGRETEEGRLMRYEFFKGFSSGAKGLAVLKAGKADAILSGVLMPFEGRVKWRLQLKAVQADTGKLITSYEGYFSTGRNLP